MDKGTNKAMMGGSFMAVVVVSDPKLHEAFVDVHLDPIRIISGNEDFGKVITTDPAKTDPNAKLGDAVTPSIEP